MPHTNLKHPVVFAVFRVESALLQIARSQRESWPEFL